MNSPIAMPIAAIKFFVSSERFCVGKSNITIRTVSVDLMQLDWLLLSLLNLNERRKKERDKCFVCQQFMINFTCNDE